VANNHFRFRSVWHIRASSDAVFTVLSDFETYPRWWPQVRRVDAIEGGYATECRSHLPYTLRFDTLQGRFDPEAGVIEGMLRGDLEGTAVWHVVPDGEKATTLVYTQEVTLRSWLQRLLPLARPAFRFNHALMMRSGARGLDRFLRQRNAPTKPM
jgi:hypothetical protein